MSQSENIERVYYSSTYTNAVDEKRRIQIPAKWGSKDTGVQFTLILWPSGIQENACLLVLPPNVWNKLVQKLEDMPFADPKSETLRRLIGTNSDRVVLDKVGRICLPEAMAKAAGIKKKAVLSGLVDRFQIWNPEHYEATEKVDGALRPEAFKQI